MLMQSDLVDDRRRHGKTDGGVCGEVLQDPPNKGVVVNTSVLCTHHLIVLHDVAITTSTTTTTSK